MPAVCEGLMPTPSAYAYVHQLYSICKYATPWPLLPGLSVTGNFMEQLGAVEVQPVHCNLAGRVCSSHASRLTAEDNLVLTVGDDCTGLGRHLELHCQSSHISRAALWQQYD